MIENTNTFSSYLKTVCKLRVDKPIRCDNGVRNGEDNNGNDQEYVMYLCIVYVTKQPYDAIITWSSWPLDVVFILSLRYCYIS